MINYKNPDIINIPNPEGIDLAYRSIQSRLGRLPWMEKPFGRAKVQVEKKDKREITFPEIWSVKREPFNLMPNDNLKAYSFFIPLDPTQYGWKPLQLQQFVTQPIAIIFWINLLKVDPDKKYDFSQSLKREILFSLSQEPDFRLRNSFEEYKNVFAEFTLTDTYKQYMKPPYYALRLEGDLDYNIVPLNC